MARLYRRFRRYRRRPVGDEHPSSSRTTGHSKTSSGRTGAGPTAALGVQPRLRVNVPGDRYEREADTVADAVASGRSAPAVSRLGPGGLPGAPAQRQALDEEESPAQRQATDEEEEPMQRQAMEEEEEPMQRQALEGEDEEAPVQRQAMKDEEETVAQRQNDEEDEEVMQAKGASATKGASVSGRGTDSRTAARAMKRTGAGAPLPAGLRIRLEHSLGHDLRSVRVHTSSAAREASDALNAKAFTRGRDVYLGPSASVSDLRLMAHEATHVVQQGHAASRRTGLVQRENDEPAGSEMRETVGMTITFLDEAASYYEHEEARSNLGTVEDVLRGWKRAAETALEGIESHLGGDDSLRQSVRASYQRAVRVYMTRVSETTDRTLPALYQEHHEIIHPWAWLPSSANPQANALLEGLPERERQQIRVVMSQEAVTISDARINEIFSTEGATVTYPRPSGATVTFGSGIASDLERGLRNVAGYLIGHQNLAVNRTVVLPLDLTAHGGDHAAYRFTYVQHVDTDGSPTSQEILVERLGEVGTQGLEGEALEAARTRFRTYGFSFGRGWSEAERKIVLRAVQQVPDAVLSQVRGITFERESASAENPQVGGDYDVDAHEITMYDRGLEASMMHHGVPGEGFSTEAVRAVAHEIGHAIDRAELRSHITAEEEARQTLEEEFGEFRTSEGGYEGVDRDLDRFNELIERARAAQEQMTETVTPSGTTYEEEEGDLQETEVAGPRATAFRRAVLQDRRSGVGRAGVRISTYADQDYGELYAESFSLYVTDPAVLRRLRPHVFQYFDNQFGGGSSGP